MKKTSGNKVSGGDGSGEINSQKVNSGGASVIHHNSDKLAEKEQLLHPIKHSF